ncbi:MAG: aminotransferase class I/II-fold pyridoxal phosphate-dependent enzyme [Actinomycetaceae bacterium]|nr:aminotransferase class I/II-fold pyridoxal phosphate-dependent enzyme [Actinomycetaceae bacterium]
MKFSTLAVHAAGIGVLGDVVPSIHTSTTFKQPVTGGPGTWEYQRGANPTRAVAQQVLAALENAQHGFMFSSGMAATAAALSLLKQGAHVIASAAVYGGTYRFLTQELPRRSQSATFLADLEELSDADFTPETAMVFIESPTNPTLRVYDIARLADLAHRNGALLVVDNTFLTPYLQNPLDLGADIVVHSATKYLAGHADLIAGVAVTNDDDLAAELGFAQNTLGAILSPTDSFRLIQGVKTLALRMERQQSNTVRLLEWLGTHPGVEALYYPGSHSPEEAAIQARQARGIGAVFSLELAPDVDQDAFVSALGIFTYAVSLGGVESLICKPASMTHEAFSAEDHAAAGIPAQLLRLAVGVEDIDDLIADLDQALSKARK